MNKKVQPSRKGTKAWRRNIDIEDVEEQMEETRKEEMMTGGKLSEKQNEEIFFMDTSGDFETKRKLASKKRLRIDEILSDRTAVKAIGTVVTRKEPERDSNGKIIKKQSNSTIEQIKKTAKALSNAKPIKKQSGPADPWAEDVLENVSESKYEFIQEAFPKKPKASVTLRQKPLMAQIVPAVELAHPGTSYRPNSKEHREAIQEAGQVEMRKLKEQKRLTALVPNKDVLIATQNLDAHLTMDVDLPSEDEQEDGAVVSDNDAKSSAAKPAKKKKKAKVTEQDLALERKRQLKREQAQFVELKKIKKDLDDKEKLQKQEKPTAEVKQARLSKHAYKPLPMAIQLSDELTDSLRSLKPEGNIFKERFNSLQKRNLIEPRVPVSTRRRYQLKEYEKHSYKKIV